MPTTITHLLGYDGPNLYGRQPCVVLHVHASADHRKGIQTALKDGALTVGMIVGYLDVSVRAAEGGFSISATFVTPTPALGVALARYVVAGLNAQEAGDEAWDAEEPLWQLQQRRRREALPLAALQIIADAARRGIPAFQRADAQLQLGYGARGMALDLAPLRVRHADPPRIAWDSLGTIPLIAVSGGADRDAAAQRIADALRAQHADVGLALGAGFDAARALLAAPHHIAVVSLDPAEIARRGLGFDRCTATAIVGMSAVLPPHVADRAEHARVLGVPMLVTDPAGVVALDARTPEIAALAAYAPCRVVWDPRELVGAIATLHHF